MPGFRRWNWLDANKAQSEHLIKGTPIRDMEIGALDSAVPFRDDPMGEVTKGVKDGKFLPQTYEERLKQERTQDNDSIAGGTYSAYGADDGHSGKTMKMSAASFTSKTSDRADLDERPDAPIFPGANDGH